MQKIEILSKHDHLKASESYVHVRFNYPEGSNYDIWVPIVYRRTNTNIDFDDKPGLNKYLEKAYNSLLPDQLRSWREEQKVFWETKKADVTKAFLMFYLLILSGIALPVIFPKIQIGLEEFKISKSLDTLLPRIQTDIALSVEQIKHI